MAHQAMHFPLSHVREGTLQTILQSLTRLTEPAKMNYLRAKMPAWCCQAVAFLFGSCEVQYFTMYDRAKHQICIYTTHQR